MKKMTSIKGQGCPAWKARAFEASIGSSSIRSNHDNKDPLWSNKPEVLDAPFGSGAGSGSPKAPLRSSRAPFSHDLDANCYSQWDLNRIIQTFFQVSSKGKSGSGNNLKAKTPDVYRNRSHMECYNFCQQYKDHFATCRAVGPNRIPFATSFLRNRINFR